MIFNHLSILLAFITLLLLGASHSEAGLDSRVKEHPYVYEDVEMRGWRDILIDSTGIPEAALDLALRGYLQLLQQRKLTNDTLLTLIDFSKPSTEKRLHLVDMRNGRLIRSMLVAHGRNSGMLTAEHFSNEISSNMSSLGLYLTGTTYEGKHGYSLRLTGISKGFNDNALQRAVVIHGADYVCGDFLIRNGRIGRSFGCPAVSYDESVELIDMIKGGSCLFIYHPAILAISPNASGKSSFIPSLSRL